MSIREISFPSANGRDTVKAWAYSPLGKPRAVIQLIHGYGEHSRRYLHMIGAFNAAGFVVYADDHIGHGKTAFDAAVIAATYTMECIRCTAQLPDHWYGAAFEPCLGKLIELLK